MKLFKLTNYLLLAIITLVTSCANNEKKVMILVKGNVTVDEAAKTIVVKDGVGNTEKEMTFNTADKISLQLTTPNKQATIEIAENGYYILNTKNDTIIGSYQNYGAAPTSAIVITQATLKKGIDSLIQLTENKNISAANRNYFILPYTAVKITNNANAFIVAPYHKMSSIEKEGDKDPEVYRFWSIKEIRQTIVDRVKDTVLVIKK